MKGGRHLKKQQYDSESWDEYGDYVEREEFKNASLARKIFSWHSFKFVIKVLVHLVIIGIIGLLLFRLFTNAPTSKMNALLRTEEDVQAYSETGGNLTVLKQQLSYYNDSSGRFTLYEVRYIVETEELQFTIRYNNSTTEALRKLYPDDTISDTPFVFVLQDNNENMYTSYNSVKFQRTLYQYERVSFHVPNMLVSELKANDLLYYPTPSTDNYVYTYKGPLMGVEGDDLVTKMYFSAYYEKEVDFDSAPFTTGIVVYSSGTEMTVYNYKNELKGNVTENMNKVTVTETK